jgi:hypothetical protein
MISRCAVLAMALGLSAAVAASAQDLPEVETPTPALTPTVETGPPATATPVPEPLAQPTGPEPEPTPAATATPPGPAAAAPATMPEAEPKLTREPALSPEPETAPPSVEPALPAQPPPVPAAAPQPTVAASAGTAPEPLRASRTARHTASQEPVDEPEDLEPCADVGPQCGVPGAACTIVGTPDDDEMTGSPFDDIICGLGGDDVIDGNGGDDVILGGGGDDEISGGGGDDCFIAGPGEDEIVGAQPGEPIAGAERDEQPEARAAPDGSCFRVEVLRGAVGAEERLEYVAGRDAVPRRDQPVAGPLAGPTQAAAFFIAIAALDEPVAPGAEAFPVTLPNRTMVVGRQLRQLLLCAEEVRGVLTYRTMRGALLAKSRFRCAPPSEVVRIELGDDELRRIEARQPFRVDVEVEAGDRVRQTTVTMETS